MKKALQQMAARLPFNWLMVFNRAVLGIRLRKMLSLANRRSARARLEELRRDVAKLLRIDPIFVASDRRGFIEVSVRSHSQELAQRCSDAVRTNPSGTFCLRRFCLCCNETMPMLVDYQYGRVEEDGTRTPNWRERLVCGGCGMNNRQRLVAKLVQQSAVQYERPKIYLMEHVTPIFEWVRKLDTAEVDGSEYLGHQYKGGQRIKGVRHEDVMNLSYPDESFELIVSNDVMEHIPDAERALRECFRVLKRGGTVLATFPFHLGNDTTKVRATLAGNAIEHLLPPQYHGNPVSTDGSLVFQDFGWDLLDTMRKVGFSPVHCESYWSDEFGHLGPGLLVFRLCKPAQSIPAPSRGGSESSAPSATLHW